MVIQRQLFGAARRASFTLSVLCLSAFFAFGNAVSVFGNTGGTSRAQSAVKRARKAKPAPAPAEASTAKGETAAGPEASAQTPTAQDFRKQGEPFLVASAEPSQTPAPRQTPPTAPTTSPAQRDATRPPGTEQRQTVPPTARPNPPADPTAPPGAQRVSPTAPPGTQVQEAAPRPAPGQTIDPTRPATPTDPLPTATPADPSATAAPEEPTFPVVQPRPVPPMPSLSRIGVVSGDTLALTLNEAIRRALENNNDIEIARADVRLAEASLRSLEGVYDPVIAYTPEINNSVRPVTNIFGGATQSGTVSSTDINNNFGVTKQFAKGGGTYSYFFNNTRGNTSALNTTLNPTFSSSQGIQFSQPLWRNRSIDRARQQIRIQRKRLEQSDADFRRVTTDTISLVQRAYWDLVFALRDEQNQIANINLTRENFRRTEASVAAGAVAPLERAEVQTELSNREAALLLATQSVTIAENNLKNLLIKDPLSPDWSRVLVPTDAPTFEQISSTSVSLEDALKEARANRQELRRLKLQGDINAIDVQFFKNQTKPQVDLTGTFATTGLAGTRNSISSTDPVPIIDGDRATTDADAFLLQQINDLRARQGLPALEVPSVVPQSGTIPPQFVGGYFQNLKNLFGFDTRNLVVGVTISLPLKNRTAEANLAFAQIQRDQLAATTRSTEQAVEVEVRNAVQAVETARRRVLAARQARQSAEEQLEGERRLYQVGRSTTFLLFQRENALVNARNQELRAETDYNKALAELQRVTSTTLRANNVIIETPSMPGRFRD